jgi:hypothetical protein
MMRTQNIFPIWALGEYARLFEHKRSSLLSQ